MQHYQHIGTSSSNLVILLPSQFPHL